MNFRAISAWKPAGFQTVHNSNETNRVQLLRSLVSRRQFARTTAGAATVGVALASEEQAAPGIQYSWTFAPVPIPTGSPAIGGFYHVFGPGPAAGSDPIDSEPATITNFNGFVGLAYLSGQVTQTNTETGARHRYPFVDSDMRFMTGTFRGTDGNEHQAAFALVWIDVYLPGPGNQIHDLNPTAFPPLGLFWTIEIPVTGVEVQLDQGRARMEARNVPILDYGMIGNALFAGGPPPVQGSVSFKVVWSGAGQMVTVRNTHPVYGGFEGQFIRNSAQMEWTGTVGNLHFESDLLATSSSSFAEIGSERNGSYFS